MNRLDRSRFEHRFYRGLDAVDTVVEGEGFVERVCGGCGAITKDYADKPMPECFDCSQKHNPYGGSIYLSVEAEGEDSTNPQRIREGTAHINLGVRGVETVVGKNPDGSDKLAYRPIAHNELQTARKRREHAKRTGSTMLEGTTKRAIGGR